MTGSLNNIATVSSSTLDSDLSDNNDNAATTINTLADVSIIKTATPNSVAAGNRLTYTLQISNHGPSDAQAVIVSDPLPGTVNLESVASSQGSCNVLPCNLGTLTANSTAIITVVVDVDDYATHMITNTATVTSSTTDPTVVNNSDREETLVITALITGTVYLDINRDGQYTAGVDTPLSGVDITITDSHGFTTTVTTDNNGYYSQTVPPGSTTIDVDDLDLPIDATLTTGATDPTVITIGAGETGVVNTGYVLPLPTATPTNTNTATAIPTATATETATAINTPTAIPTAINTPTVIPTATDTATVIPTATATSTPIATIDLPVRLASLGDLVWFDTNQDGVQDYNETGAAGTTDERGVPGVLVKLYNADTSAMMLTTTTNTHGRYWFNNLTPGRYFIEFVPPAGYELSPVDQTIDGQPDDAFDSDVSLTSWRSPAITLTAGDHNATLDIGLYLPEHILPVVVDDRVWYDDNHNGLQETNETGVAGVTVALYQADGTLIATATTNATGNYQFNSIPPGTYYLTITPPPGYFISTPNVGNNDELDSDVDALTGRTAPFSLTPGQHDSSWDLGIYSLEPPATLGDRIWFDTNDNNIQDEGETGILGVQVVLYRADGTQVATTTSDVDGHYMFNNLAPGNYYLHFIAPAGYLPVLADQEENDLVDSDADPRSGQTPLFTLPGGVNAHEWDAGFTLRNPITDRIVLPAVLGDRVWYDIDQDGFQDNGEANAADVTVKLYNSNGELLAVTVTDVSGNYRFANLAPGFYSIEFVLPVNYRISPSGGGAFDGLDSNAHPQTGRTVVVTLEAGENDPTWDAGIYPIPTALEASDEPVRRYHLLLPMVTK